MCKGTGHSPFLGTRHFVLIAKDTLCPSKIWHNMHLMVWHDMYMYLSVCIWDCSVLFVFFFPTGHDSHMGWSADSFPGLFVCVYVYVCVCMCVCVCGHVQPQDVCKPYTVHVHVHSQVDQLLYVTCKITRPGLQLRHLGTDG